MNCSDELRLELAREVALRCYFTGPGLDREVRRLARLEVNVLSELTQRWREADGEADTGKAPPCRYCGYVYPWEGTAAEVAACVERLNGLCPACFTGHPPPVEGPARVEWLKRERRRQWAAE